MWGFRTKTEEATIVETTTIDEKPEKIVPKKTASIIAADVKILGSVIGSSDLAVDGSIEGDVRCAQFTLGKDGVVSGNIIAETATIRGKVIGNVNARTIMLSGKGSIDGDLTHSVLIIEEGGVFEGRSRRVADPLAEATLVIAAPEAQEKTKDKDKAETDTSESKAEETKTEEAEVKEADAIAGKPEEAKAEVEAETKEAKAEIKDEKPKTSKAKKAKEEDEAEDVSISKELKEALSV